MNLYCDRHNAVHEFTPGQVELIVYSLTCATAAAQCEPDGDRIFAGEDAMSNMPCPIEYLSMATDIEGFGEVVEAWVEGRRAITRKPVSRRLTERQVLDIRTDTRSHRTVGAAHGVSHTTVRKIQARQIWRSVG